MRVIHVLKNLDLFEWTDGRLWPSARGANGHDPVRVHWRQGDYDGACGPYAALIALGLLGIDTSSDAFKARFYPTLGQVLRENVLSHEGTRPHQIRQLVQSIEVPAAARVKTAKTGPARLAMAVELLKADMPAIMWMTSRELSHWSVAVGCEYETEDAAAHRLFLLDPAQPVTQVGYWNAVLTRNRGRGFTRFDYGTPECTYRDVRLNTVISLGA